MKSAAHTGLGSITVLSLLALLAIAIGAQAASAVQSSTPAAGTQGRGGVSAPASVSAVVVTTPAAGTQGRGGVAAGPGSATPAQAAATATGGSGLPIRARGGIPRPVSGVAALPASAATTSSFGVWLAVGIAGAVLLVSIIAWMSYRRRGSRGESSLVEFCALHPNDAACGSA